MAKHREQYIDTLEAMGFDAGTYIIDHWGHEYLKTDKGDDWCFIRLSDGKCVNHFSIAAPYVAEENRFV